MDIKLVDNNLASHPSVQKSLEVEQSAQERIKRLASLTKELGADPQKLQTYRTESARIMGGIYLNTGVAGEDLEREINKINSMESPAEVAAQYLTTQELYNQRQKIEVSTKVSAPSK